MASFLKHTIQPRISKILNEGGDRLSDLSVWELNFLEGLQKEDIAFGSQKQNAIVDGIGSKVFGERVWADYTKGKEIK